MIGVVVINYKNWKETVVCVEAILKLQGDILVSIVDNSVDSVEWDMLNAALGDKNSLVLTNAGSNLGYARANNLGVQALLSRSFIVDYLVFANTDISFPDIDVLVYLENKMKLDSSVGSCNPLIITKDGKVTQTPYRYLPFYRKFTLRYLLYPLTVFFAIDNLWNDLVEDAQEGSYHRLSGAFLMVRLSSFLEVKGFDDGTFLYAEESILAERLSSIGMTSNYYKDRQVYHEISKNVGVHFDSFIKAKMILKSNIYYHRKYKSLRLIDGIAGWIALNIYFKAYGLFKFLR